MNYTAAAGFITGSLGVGAALWSLSTKLADHDDKMKIRELAACSFLVCFGAFAVVTLDLVV
jgi:hypothetical protein